MVPKNYQCLYSAEAIQESLRKVSTELSPWLEAAEKENGQQVLIIGILHGAIFVLADLLRNLNLSVEPAFCRVSSYSTEDNTQGAIKVSLEGVDVQGRVVLLVDDICDTGVTLRELGKELLSDGAKEVRSLVLIRRMLENAVSVPDWSAIEHRGDEWFVGYGMDDMGRNRNLKDIYWAKQDGQET